MKINNTTKLLYEQKKDKFYIDVGSLYTKILRLIITLQYLNVGLHISASMTIHSK